MRILEQVLLDVLPTALSIRGRVSPIEINVVMNSMDRSCEATFRQPMPQVSASEPAAREQNSRVASCAQPRTRKTRRAGPKTSPARVFCADRTDRSSYRDLARAGARSRTPGGSLFFLMHGSSLMLPQTWVARLSPLHWEWAPTGRW